MNALEWILKAALTVAIFFFGLAANPQDNNQPEKEKSAISFFR